MNQSRSLRFSRHRPTSYAGVVLALFLANWAGAAHAQSASLQFQAAQTEMTRIRNASTSSGPYTHRGIVAAPGVVYYDDGGQLTTKFIAGGVSYEEGNVPYPAWDQTGTKGTPCQQCVSDRGAAECVRAGICRISTKQPIPRWVEYLDDGTINKVPNEWCTSCVAMSPDAYCSAYTSYQDAKVRAAATTAPESWLTREEFFRNAPNCFGLVEACQLAARAQLGGDLRTQLDNACKCYDDPTQSGCQPSHADYRKNAWAKCPGNCGLDGTSATTFWVTSASSPIRSTVDPISSCYSPVQVVGQWRESKNFVQALGQSQTTDLCTAASPWRSLLVDTQTGQEMHRSKGVIGYFTSYFTAIEGSTCQRYGDLDVNNPFGRSAAKIGGIEVPVIPAIGRALEGCPAEPDRAGLPEAQRAGGHIFRLWAPMSTTVEFVDGTALFSGSGRSVTGTGYWSAQIIPFNWAANYLGRFDDSMAQGTTMHAKVHFAPFTTRSNATRYYYLPTFGSGSGNEGGVFTNFAIDAGLISGQFRFVDPSGAGIRIVTGGRDPSTGAFAQAGPCTPSNAAGCGSFDYIYPRGVTNYSSKPDDLGNLGLLREIGQASARDTTIYVFRESDGRLAASRWGLTNMELNCAVSKRPGAPEPTLEEVPGGPGGYLPKDDDFDPYHSICHKVPGDAENSSFTSYQQARAWDTASGTFDILYRGVKNHKAASYASSEKGPDGKPLYIESKQPSLSYEADYRDEFCPQGNTSDFCTEGHWERQRLRAGEQVKLVMLNHATGYIGTQSTDLLMRGGVASTHSKSITLGPPNLKIHARRVSARSPDTEYVIGSEGAGLDTDIKIEIITEWYDADGSALPAELAMTGRLFKSVSAEEAAGGPRLVQIGNATTVTSAPEEEEGDGGAPPSTPATPDDRAKRLSDDLKAGHFPILPGKHIVALTIPSSDAAAHFYVHVDGAHPSFMGGSGSARTDRVVGNRPYGPDFSASQVCYWGVAANTSNPAEPCDGRDNNGNGVTDEGCGDMAPLHCESRVLPDPDSPSSPADVNNLFAERPWTYVPVKVPVFDKAGTEAELRRLIAEKKGSYQPGAPAPTIDEIPRIYKWLYRPEYHFSVLDLKTTDIDLATTYDADKGSQTSLGGNYTLGTAPADELGRFGGNRTVYWGVGRSVIEALADSNSRLGGLGSLEHGASTLRAEEGYVNDQAWDDLTAEDYLALSMWVKGDEANPLFEYQALPLLLTEAQPITLTKRLHHVNQPDKQQGDLTRTDYRAIPFAVPQFKAPTPASPPPPSPAPGSPEPVCPIPGSSATDTREVKVRARLAIPRPSGPPDFLATDLVPPKTLTPCAYYLILEYEDVAKRLRDAGKQSVREFFVYLEATDGDNFIADTKTLGDEYEATVVQSIQFPVKLTEEVTGIATGQTIVHDVLIQDGSLLLTREDFRLPGHGPQIALTRNYSSTAGDRESVLGPGWSHSLDLRVTPYHAGGWGGTDLFDAMKGLTGSFATAETVKAKLPGSANGVTMVSARGTESRWKAVVLNGTTFTRLAGSGTGGTTAVWVPERGRHGKLEEVVFALGKPSPGTDADCPTEKRCFRYTSVDGTQYVYDIPDFATPDPAAKAHVSTRDTLLQRLGDLPDSGLGDGGPMQLDLVDSGMRIGNPVASDGGQQEVEYACGSKVPRPSRYDFPRDTPARAIRDRYGNTLTLTPHERFPELIGSVEDRAHRKCELSYDHICSALPKAAASATTSNAEKSAMFRGIIRLKQVTCLSDAGANLQFVVSFDYDEKGLLTKVSRSGRTEQYEYKPEQRTDPPTTPEYNLSAILSPRPGSQNPADLVKTEIQYHQEAEIPVPTTGPNAPERAFRPFDAVKLITYPALSGNHLLGEDHPIQFGYDVGLRRRTVTDARGNPTTYLLTSKGHPKRIEEPGRTTDLVWNYEGGSCGGSATDAWPCQETVRSDATLHQPAFMRVTRYRSYDAHGNATEWEVEQGGEVLYSSATFDPFSRPLTRRLGVVAGATSGGVFEQFTYGGPNGELTQYTDAAGRRWIHSTPDPRNRGLMKQVFNPAGAPGGYVETDYDDMGLPRSVTEPQGEDPVNRTTLYSYDPRGRLRKVTSPLDRETIYDYDDLDRLVRIKHPDLTPDAPSPQVPVISSPFESFTYDLVGNKLTETDRNGVTLTYTYTARGQVATATRSVRTATRTFQYDGNGNLTSETDWTGLLTIHDYNDLNRRITTTLGGFVSSFEYDGAGNLTYKEDATTAVGQGVQTRLAYDALDRVTEQRVRNRTPAINAGSAAPAVEPEYVTRTQYVASSVTGAVYRVTQSAGTGNAQVTHTDLDGLSRPVRRASDAQVSTRAYWSHGPLQEEIDENHRSVKYDVDARGRVQAVTRTFAGKTRTTEFDYDAAGNRTHERRGGEQWVTKYDEWNRVTKRFAPDDLNEAATHLYYDGMGNIVQVTRRESGTETYQRDALGWVEFQTDTRGRWEFKYDANGEVESTKDPLELTTTVTDRDARRFATVVTQSAPAGTKPATRVVEYKQHDGIGNPREIVAYGGAAITVDYNAFNAPKAQCRGGFCELTTFRDTGAVASVANRNGDVTTYQYDAVGRVTSIEFAGVTQEMRYHPNGLLSAEQDRSGHWTHYAYDDPDLSLTSTSRSDSDVSPGDEVERRSYDDAGRLEQLFDADALERGQSEPSQRFVYATGRLDEVHLPAIAGQGAAVLKHYYDDHGRLRKREIVGTPHSLIYGYHADGRVKTEQFAGLPPTTYEYNAVGDLAKVVSPRMNSSQKGRSLVYDAYRRLQDVTDEAGIKTHYDYDVADNLTDVFMAQGTPAESHVSFSYDALDRLSTRSEHVGTTQHITRYQNYTNEGDFKLLIDAKGNEVEYEYDPLRRRTLATYREATPNTPGLPTTPHRSIRWNYVGARLAGVDETRTDGSTQTTTYDAPDLFDRPHTVTSRGVTIDLEYTRGGAKKRVHTSEGDTAYEYNARNLLEKVTANNGATTYAYRGDNLLSSISRSGGLKTDFGYDPQSLRVASINHTKTGQSVATLTFAYDDNGNPKTETVNIPGRLVSTIDATGQYDDIDRLKKYTQQVVDSADPEHVTNVTRTVEFTFEGYHRKTETVHVGGTPRINNTYAYQGDRLDSITNTGIENPGVTSFGYDPNGNLILRDQAGSSADDITYEYDSRDMLVQVTRGPPGAATALGRYAYDADGMRIREQGERGDVDAFWALGELIEERHGAQSPDAGELLAHYRYEDGGALFGIEDDVGPSFAHLDPRGSTTFLTNPAGAITDAYALDPWGGIAARQGSSQNRKLFTGHQSDVSTGLVYAKARYYDPSTGGFLTRDSWQGNASNPYSLNKYAYGYHNPLRYTDPAGHIPYNNGVYDGEYHGPDTFRAPAPESPWAPQDPLPGYGLADGRGPDGKFPTDGCDGNSCFGGYVKEDPSGREPFVEQDRIAVLHAQMRSRPGVFESILSGLWHTVTHPQEVLSNSLMGDLHPGQYEYALRGDEEFSADAYGAPAGSSERGLYILLHQDQRLTSQSGRAFDRFNYYAAHFAEAATTVIGAGGEIAGGSAPIGGLPKVMKGSVGLEASAAGLIDDAAARTGRIPRRGTLGNLWPEDVPGSQRGVVRLVREEGIWYELSRFGKRRARGEYDYVLIPNGEIRAARTRSRLGAPKVGHVSLANGERIDFAGSVRFGKKKSSRGVVKTHSNDSGHYAVPRAFSNRAPFDPNRFVPADLSDFKRGPQLPVIQPK